MTSIPGSRFTLPSDYRPLSSRNIFLVIGLACIAAFAMNLLAFAIPPDPMALEWRIAFMQQVSGRAILLFLGAAMVTYGCLVRRTLSRYLALACLLVGVLFLLSGVIVIRDGLVLQNQGLDTIKSQATELRSQLQTAQASPNLPAEVTPERIKEALAQVEGQAEALSNNTRNSTTKAMVSVLGTQIVIGLGFLGLGRFGIKHSA